MARNFDDELTDDLSFVVQGETFTMQLASPKVLARYEDEPDAANAEESIERLTARIVDFLIEGDRARWLKMMEDEKVPFVQLQSLATWSWGVQTGRPTTPVSPSAAGRGSTGATSSGGEAARAASARQAARTRGRR